MVNHCARRLVFVSHVLVRIQMSVYYYVLLQQNLKPPKCPPVSADTLLTQELTAAGASRMEEEVAVARCFLESFVKEFPAPLEEDSPLPVSPLSRRISLEELHGESLEMGQRLLAARYCIGKENTLI